jgi:hypothetical protein
VGDQAATWSVDVGHRMAEQVRFQTASEVHGRWLQVEAGQKMIVVLLEAALGT